MLRIDHLYFFLAVAQTSSINAAAQQLNLTPPAISHALKKFERDLGLTLFTRSSKGVTLTDEGVSVAKKIKEIVAELDELEKMAHHLHQKTHVPIPKLNNLTLFSESAIFNSHLSSLSDKIYKEFPNIDLIIAEQPLKKTMEEISSDPFAIAILLIGSDLIKLIHEKCDIIGSCSIASYPLQIMANRKTKFLPNKIPDAVFLEDIKTLPFIKANWASSSQYTYNNLTKDMLLNYVAVAPNLSAYNAFLVNDIGLGFGCKIPFGGRISPHKFISLILDQNVTIDYCFFYNKEMDSNIIRTLHSIISATYNNSIKYSLKT